MPPQPRDLFGMVIGIDCGFLDHFVELGIGRPRVGASVFRFHKTPTMVTIQRFSILRISDDRRAYRSRNEVSLSWKPASPPTCRYASRGFRNLAAAWS